MKRIRLSSSLDDNGYNWIGVILLTFFGKLFMHFCINIENYKNVSNWLLLISALFFLVSGIKYLTSSALFKDAIDFWERNKQMDDYKSRNKTISDQTNSNIKNKWILYIGPILAFLFLVSYPITKSSWLPSISSDSSKSHNLPRSHSKLTFDTYDRLADEYGFYSTQSDFLLSLIDSNKIYPSLVIDAQCCYGKTISLLNTCSTDSTIIKGCYFENESFKESTSNGVNALNLIKCHWASMNDCFKENEADIIYLFNNSLPELTHSDFSDSIFSQYFNILKEDGLFIFDFENLDEYNNDLASHDFKGIRREKIFKKNNEEYYWVNYYYFDVTKKLSDSLILSRPHSQNLCNIDFLTSKLKDHGFSSINIEKIEGYPFNIMIAKK